MRTKNKKYLPYDFAQQFVQQKTNCRSRKQYHRWHDKEKPPFLPKHPESAYEEWESWNVFLGTTNSFDKTRRGNKRTVPHRPFWDAVRYAQKIASENNLTTLKDWTDWCENNDELPIDIPRFPQSVYKEFSSSVWLGKKVEAKIEAHKAEIGVFIIASVPSMPANIVKTIHERDGLSAAKEKWNGYGVARPYRVYKWEQELATDVMSTFNRFCTQKDGGLWLVPNMNALLFDLDCLLEYAVPPQHL